MIGGLVAISAGVGGRAVFGLVFAFTIIRNLPSEGSVAFFQTVLLQSVFISLIGGGGYVRGAAQSGSVTGSVRLLRGYLSALVLGVGGVLLLEMVLKAPPVTARWQLYLLLASGAATALNAHLMGILSGISGFRRIFLPLSLLFFMMSAVLLFVPPQGFAAAIAIVGFSQIAPLILLLLLNVEARNLLLAAISARRGFGPGSWKPTGSLIVGGATAAYLLIFFAFRESWSAGVAPEIAAAAFFAYRISETYFQVFSVAISGARRLTEFVENSVLRSGRLTGVALLGLVFAGIAQVAAVLVLQENFDWLGIILVCTAMQLACEFLRVGTAMVSVIELKSGRTFRFLALTVVPAATAAGLVLISGRMAEPAGFFLFQTAFAALQIVLWVVLVRLGTVWQRRKGVELQ